jgi:hypothetical protein
MNSSAGSDSNQDYGKGLMHLPAKKRDAFPSKLKKICVIRVAENNPVAEWFFGG